MNADYLHPYTDHMHLRGLRPATIKRRVGTLALFARHVAPCPLAAVDADMVADFLGGYRMPRTRHAYRADLAAFYRWAHRRRLVAADPLDDVDTVRVPKGLPRPIAPTTIPSIVAACHDADLALMVALAAYAGLRRAEIAALSADDIAAGVIVVRDGKGGKDRAIPAHPVILRLLVGRRGPLFAVCAQTVGRRIRAHLRACGIDGTCHQLRHSFGTELARVSHGDLLTVGALMGHESPVTTLGYTALSGDRGADAVAHLYAA